MAQVEDARVVPAVTPEAAVVIVGEFARRYDDVVGNDFPMSVVLLFVVGVVFVDVVDDRDVAIVARAAGGRRCRSPRLSVVVELDCSQWNVFIMRNGIE